MRKKVIKIVGFVGLGLFSGFSFNSFGMEENLLPERTPINYCTKLPQTNDQIYYGRETCQEIVQLFSSWDFPSIEFQLSYYPVQDFDMRIIKDVLERFKHLFNKNIFLKKNNFPFDQNIVPTRDICFEYALLTLFENQNVSANLIKKILKHKLNEIPLTQKADNTTLGILQKNKFQISAQDVSCDFYKGILDKNVGLMIFNHLDLYTAQSLGSTSKGWNKLFIKYKSQLNYYIKALRQMDLLPANFSINFADDVSCVKYLLAFEKTFEMLKKMYNEYPILMESFPNSIFREDYKNSLYNLYGKEGATLKKLPVSSELLTQQGINDLISFF